MDYRVHGRNTIRENDERGSIEDNFVLEWHLHNGLAGMSRAGRRDSTPRYAETKQEGLSPFDAVISTVENGE